MYAARSPSLPRRGYTESSSPDPLALSIHEDDLPASRRQSVSRRSLGRSSPTKINPTVKILEDVTASSSQRGSRRTSLKTTTMTATLSPATTPARSSEQNLSPWKIRVTVEAEPENTNMENQWHNTKTVTKTVKIPLRGESSPTVSIEHNPKARGRNTSVATRGRGKRSGTPVRKTNSSPARTRRPSVNDLDVTVLGDDNEEDDWTRRNSTGTKSASRRKRSSRGAGEHPTAFVSDELAHSNTSEPIEHGVPEDDESALGEIDNAQDTSSELRTVDLNRVSVRSRSLSTKSRPTNLGVKPSAGYFQEHHVSTGSKNRQVSGASAKSYPTPSPTSSYHGGSDPYDQPEPFDTVLESEGFTMIDLDSIPSARHFRSPPLELDEAQKRQLDHLPSPINTNQTSNDSTSARFIGNIQPPRVSILMAPQIAADGEYELSSTVPSSPPGSTSSLLKPPQLRPSVLRKVTPNTYTSPQLPSPPKVMRRSPKVRPTGPSVSSEVLTAGLALQNMMDPATAIMDNPPINVMTRKPLPARNLENLFQGFDSGTKRELRAGLRFGEELAKRQSSPPETVLDTVSAQSDLADKRVMSTAPPQPQVWRDENKVQRHSQNMIEDQKKQQDANVLSNLERKWQLEREAVAHEIHNAPKEQVVALDEEDSPMQADSNLMRNKTPTSAASIVDAIVPPVEEDNDDIWLAEARNSSSPPSSNLFSTESQRRQRERAREIVNKPRRSLIPSPWKRGEPAADASTFLTNGDISGLFWPPSDSKLKFGAGQIKQQRRELSGRFDLDQMAGTPRRRDLVDETRADIDHSTENIQDGECDAQSEEEGYESTTSSHTSRDTPPYDAKQTPVVFDGSLTSEAEHEENGSEGDTIEVIPSARRETTPTSPVGIRETPPTPRSAMKGGRIMSFGGELPEVEDRRVIFSHRSRGMDINGMEDSFSAKGSETSIASEINWKDIGPRQDSLQELVHQAQQSQQLVAQPVLHPTETHDGIIPEAETAKTGWSGWLWKSQPAEKQGRAGPSSRTRSKGHDGQVDPAPEVESEWQTTKTAIKSHTLQREDAQRVRHERASRPERPVESYLLPPSYPSDPNRDPSTPLAVSGEFTKTHFRTLHIIHSKSQRPRFHHPKKVRRGLRKLMELKIEVDESDSGMGLFEWVVGEREVLVLERFMQEVEYGWQCNGRSEQLTWEWSEEQLANWLCRIVVGEVVREEEKTKK